MARVVSCRFLRLSCSEEDHSLFHREYARSNRERGVKLLRCFPHCCPEHARRSYCGCSVHVLVTFSSSVSAAELDDLVVCARFEPSRVAPRWPAGLEHIAGLVRRDGGNLATEFGRGNDETSDDSRQEDERRLGVGESVVLPASLFSSSGRRSSMESVWIRADRESDAKQKTVPENSVLYVVNNCRFPKWYYNYDSSVTRTQRDMTHHFVAYAFRLTGVVPTLQQQQYQQQADQIEAVQQQEQGPTTNRQAVVLASVASPSFLLISFRRSGSAIVANNAAAASAVAVSPEDNVGTPPQSKRSPEAYVWGHRVSESRQKDVGQRPIEQRQHSSGVGTQKGRNPPVSPPKEQYTSAELDGARCNPQVNNALWQQRIDADFSEKGQQLLILWRFLQNLTLHDLHVDERIADMDLEAYWGQGEGAKEVLSGQLEDIMHRFLRELFGRSVEVDPVHELQPERVDKQSLSARDDSIVRVVAHCFLRVLSSRTVQRRLHSAWAVRDDVPTKEQLHERFVRMVSSLYDAFESDLREMARESGLKLAENGSKYLPILVDDVLSIVYGRARFKVLRPSMSTLLMGLSAPGSVADALNHAFEAFTAQAREAMISSAARNHGDPQPSRAIEGDEPRIDTQRAWNRRWLLKPSSIEVINGGPDRFRDLLLVDLARLVYEFGRLDVVVDEDSRLLSLRSALSSTSGTSASSMDLVLDGRLHVFRALPSGLSSMIPTTGGWSVGDYVAEFSSDMETLYVDLFVFAEGVGAAHDDVGVATRRVSLAMTMEQALTSQNVQSGDVALSVYGTVSSSTYGTSRVSGRREKDDSSLSAMSSSHRTRLYDEMQWTAVLEVQAHCIPGAH